MAQNKLNISEVKYTNIIKLCLCVKGKRYNHRNIILAKMYML